MEDELKKILKANEDFSKNTTEDNRKKILN